MVTNSVNLGLKVRSKAGMSLPFSIVLDITSNTFLEAKKSEITVNMAVL
jgi:hypothetical protein